MNTNDTSISSEVSDGNDRAPLVRGPIGPHLVSQAIPMAWAFVATFGFNIVDTFFVAQLGTAQLAALTLTGPIIGLVYGITFGIGIGVASVVSRGLGGGSITQVQRAVVDSLILGSIIVTLLMIVGLPTIDPLFRMLGGNDNTMPYVHEYMEIWYWGVITVVVPMMGMNAIRAAGDTRSASRILIYSSIANCILDPIFIFGWGPVPAMGVQGAAIATVIAQVLSFVIAAWLLRHKDLITLVRPKFSEMMDSWKRVLHVGAPACATELVMPVVFSFIMVFLASFGDEALAGFGVASKIEMIAFIPIIAVNSTMGPFSGQNFGAGRMDRVHQAMGLSLRFVFLYGLGVAVLLALVSTWLPSLFDSNPEVIRTARNYLLIVPCSYALIGASFTMISALNALGFPKPSMWLNIIRMIFLYLPLAWYLKGIWGPAGIFAATPVGFVLMFVATAIWYKRIVARLDAEAMERIEATGIVVADGEGEGD
jgi:putative MATE family efflux protein